MIKPGKLILIRHASVKKKEGFLPEHNPEAIINDNEFKKLSRNIPEDSVWRFLKAIYGLVNALRKWWKRVCVRSLKS